MFNFNSISECGEYCRTLGINPGAASYDYPPSASNGFIYGTAIDSALSGGAWPEGAQDLSAVCVAGDFQKPLSVRRVHAAECGFIPLIPNALMGLPDSLLTITREQKEFRVLRIGVNVGRLYSLSERATLARGRAILRLVNALEAIGYKTEIIALWVNSANGQRANIQTMVKPINEAPNLSALAFCFCSFAFQRRLMWRIAEAHYPIIAANNYGNGQGYKGTKFDVYFPYADDNENWLDENWALGKLGAMLRNINLSIEAA